jgi:hypothetical protein
LEIADSKSLFHPLIGGIKRMYIVEVKTNDHTIQGICPGREEDGSIMLIEGLMVDKRNQLHYNGLYFLKKEEYHSFLIKDCLGMAETLQVYNALSDGAKTFCFSFYAKELFSGLSPQFAEFIYENDFSFEELILLESLFRKGIVQETIIGLAFYKDGERVATVNYSSKSDAEELRKQLQYKLKEVNKFKRKFHVPAMQSLLEKLAQ